MADWEEVVVLGSCEPRSQLSFLVEATSRSAGSPMHFDSSSEHQSVFTHMYPIESSGQLCEMWHSESVSCGDEETDAERDEVTCSGSL